MTEAIIGLAGVIIGAAITFFGEYIHRGWERDRRARFLSVRTVVALDAYVDACAEAVTPIILSGEEPGEMPRFADPLALPDDVDWMSVNPGLAYRILSLKNDEREAREEVHQAFAQEYFGDAIQYRDERFIDLGLAAYDLASELRKTFGTPQRPSATGVPYSVTRLRDFQKRISEENSRELEESVKAIKAMKKKAMKKDADL